MHLERALEDSAGGGGEGERISKAKFSYFALEPASNNDLFNL